MSTTIEYKGSTLTTVSNETKTLETAGTWLEDDITITDVSGGSEAISVVDTLDSHGGTIRTITAVDLSGDTVYPGALLAGYTAHDALGNPISGTASSGITPSGTLSIVSNGIYDVASYASAFVSVSGGGGGYTADEIAMRTISGKISGNASTITGYAFRICQNITEASFPSCTYIGEFAFQNCYSLSSVSFPLCNGIGSSAFFNCSHLTNLYFPECSTLFYYAFRNCSSVTTANFPKCSQILNYCFAGCVSLYDISFPSCATISSSAFYGCGALTSLDFPMCKSIGNSAFMNCSSTRIIRFLALESAQSYAFGNDYLISTAIFSNSLPSTSYGFFGNYAFNSCYNLLSLYLLAPNAIYRPNMSNVFANTPISTRTTSTGGVRGNIFVPSSLYDTYISYGIWGSYVDRFVSLTDTEIQNVISYGTHIAPT